MEYVDIEAIGIDDASRLWIKPRERAFPYIYREAMEVHWNDEAGFLYSPKPRKWTYVKWFQQVVDAARQQGCCLRVTEETRWENIPRELQEDITGMSEGERAQ